MTTNSICLHYPTYVTASEFLAASDHLHHPNINFYRSAIEANVAFGATHPSRNISEISACVGYFFEAIMKGTATPEILEHFTRLLFKKFVSAQEFFLDAGIFSPEYFAYLGTMGISVQVGPFLQCMTISELSVVARYYPAYTALIDEEVTQREQRDATSTVIDADFIRTVTAQMGYRKSDVFTAETSQFDETLSEFEFNLPDMTTAISSIVPDYHNACYSVSDPTIMEPAVTSCLDLVPSNLIDPNVTMGLAVVWTSSGYTTKNLSLLSQSQSHARQVYVCSCMGHGSRPCSSICSNIPVAQRIRAHDKTRPLLHQIQCDTTLFGRRYDHPIVLKPLPLPVADMRSVVGRRTVGGRCKPRHGMTGGWKTRRKLK